MDSSYYMRHAIAETAGGRQLESPTLGRSMLFCIVASQSSHRNRHRDD
ncbi:hypothetical protein OAE37_02845 [Pirellulaceae bacterium]|nr:hypothetical protein [Pirellulaceae bacterium]